MGLRDASAYKNNSRKVLGFPYLEMCNFFLNEFRCSHIFDHFIHFHLFKIAMQ